MPSKPAVILIAALLLHAASAADPDPCTRFTWDVSHELAVMQQKPRAIAAATKPGSDAPLLEVGRLYEVRLVPQAEVTFAVTPGRQKRDDDAHAGMVRLRTEKPGRYRIALSSRHWVDIVDGGKPIESRDFQGAAGCSRPHKIVEFDLPGDSELVLQLSGAREAAILLGVTALAPASAR